MTNEEALNILRVLKNCYNDKSEDSFIGFDDKDNEALNIAIKVLEQQPSEDCISRKDVLSLFNKSDEYRWETTWIRRKIEKLPYVTPKQKVGKWILRNSFLVPYKCSCSECNYESERYDNYCPNCGVKMEVEENG